MPPCDTVVNGHYPAYPTEVAKCLKFLPVNFIPCACADKSKNVQMNFLLQNLKV